MVEHIDKKIITEAEKADSNAGKKNSWLLPDENKYFLAIFDDIFKDPEIEASVKTALGELLKKAINDYALDRQIKGSLDSTPDLEEFFYRPNLQILSDPKSWQLISNLLRIFAPNYYQQNILHLDSAAAVEKNVANVLRDMVRIAASKRNTEANSKLDILTNLFNRPKFLNDLEKLIERHNAENLPAQNLERRHNPKLEFSVVIIDLDFFKQINDQYGHEIGDLALKNLAEIFKNCIRSKDRAHRYGGDEFTLIIYGAPAETQKVLERIHFRLAGDQQTRQPLIAHGIIGAEVAESDNPEQKAFIKTGDIFATVSIGWIHSNDVASSHNFTQVIAAADTALYIAKNNGRNQIVRFQK